MQIRLPVPAIISIMHRVSGAVLFLSLPLLLWLLAAKPDHRPNRSNAFRSSSPIRWSSWCCSVCCGAYLHHLCAGMRHLLLDLDIGTDLEPARATSTPVLACSIVLTLVAGR